MDVSWKRVPSFFLPIFPKVSDLPPADSVTDWGSRCGPSSVVPGNPNWRRLILAGKYKSTLLKVSQIPVRKWDCQIVEFERQLYKRGITSIGLWSLSGRDGGYER